MSNVLNYITANGLTCITWIDATDPTFVTVSGSTFTAKNKTGNTAYDFIQNTPALHPTITSTGISFSGDKRLSPRQADIFSPVVASADYSMIFVTKGNPNTEQQLLSIAKTNPLLPKFVDIRQAGNKAKHSFANLNLESFVYSTDFNSSTQVYMFTHNIRLGRTNTSVNKQPFSSHVNSSKGYMLNNFPSTFYLGNSNTTLPFSGNLLHFLIFIPGLSETHLFNIANMLSDTKPYNNVLSTDYAYSAQQLLDVSSTVTFTPTVTYVPPVLKFQAFQNSIVDLDTVVSLAFAVSWNTLQESDWNGLDTNAWNILG